MPFPRLSPFDFTPGFMAADGAEGGGGSAPSAPEIAAKGYTLAWADEFDGGAVDADKWEYRTDSKALSTQLPRNVSVSGGLLRIALKKERALDKDYTGGGVISRREFQYGCYEARMRVPSGPGWHTSFWLQQYNGVDTGINGVAQEIDVCEQDSGNPRHYMSNVHDWAGNPAHSAVGEKHFETEDLGADFHVFGCEFTPEAVHFYRDGRLTHSVDGGAFIHGPQRVWLTSIGYETRPDDSRLPAEAVFDYVRFFEKR